MEDSLDNHKGKSKFEASTKWSCKLILKYALRISIIIALIVMSVTGYVYYNVYPEVGMVLNSQCSNPAPSWNGKFMGFQVFSAIKYIFLLIMSSGLG